ncbi:MAG: cellulose biosynthesis cyclic di-GMP-binding regulatory protein BcsB, partial [Spartobacteria bacterium]
MKTKLSAIRILPIAAAILFSSLTVHSAPAETPRSAESFDLPLLEFGDGRLEGVLAKKDYTFRLPEHVRYEPGSEMVLSYRASPLLLDVSTFTVSLNERQIASARLGHEPDGAEKQNDGVLTVPIPEGVLLPGWNRLVVRCLLQTTQTLCRDVDNPAAWLEFAPATVLRVAYS